MKNLFYLFFLLSYYGQAQENLLRPEIQAYIDSIEVAKIYPMSPNYYYYIKTQEKYDILKEIIYPSEVEFLKKSTNPKEIEIASRITAYYKVKEIEAQIAERNYKSVFEFLRLPYNPMEDGVHGLTYSIGGIERKIQFFKKIQKKDLKDFLKYKDPRVQLLAAIALIDEYKDIKSVLNLFPKFLIDRRVMTKHSGCVISYEHLSDYIANTVAQKHPEFKPEIDDVVLRTPNQTNYYFNLYAPENPYIKGFSPNEKQLKFLDKEFQKTQKPMSVYPLIRNNDNYDIELVLKAVKKEFLKENPPSYIMGSYNYLRPLESVLYGLGQHRNKKRVLEFYSEIHQKNMSDTTFRNSIPVQKMQKFYQSLSSLYIKHNQLGSQENKRQSILEEAAENKLFIKY